MSPFKDKTILKILDYYKNLWALSYTTGIVHWDLETYMPKDGASARGEALARISTLRQKMFLDDEFVKLIHKSKLIKGLTSEEKAVVRILLKNLEFYEKLPSSFLEEFEKLTNTATVVWRDAKTKNNYKLFEPHLKKIFEMNRKMTELIGFEDSPYDALLDMYEEDLKTTQVLNHFNSIIPQLKNILTRIINSKNYIKSHYLEKARYDKVELQILNQKVLADFWPQFGNNFRLDVSSHPFTTSFSNKDTRITTWYHEKDFGRSLMATIHEFGHALYDLQSEDKLEMTPVAGGSSLVVHESQSRFWENHVGRSRTFIEKYIKNIRKVLNNNKVTVEDVYTYLNKVSPGPLRVEADEVTYHFHIALRFEIEKGLIEGKLKFKDLKEIWNEKMKDYLGIMPKNDSEGVLQDIHWSGGSVGYFPTYSLGTFLGSQWEEKCKEEIKNGNYSALENWLKKNIHRYGSTYVLGDLLTKNKMQFDSQVNLNYLEKKYSEIYGF